MAALWAGYILKAGEWLARTAFNALRLEHARSGAEEGFPHRFELLEPFVGESIDLIISGRPSATSSPWRWLQYMASTPPANLQTPGVADWLLRYEVRQASVEAIKARLNGEIDEKAEKQLLDTWSAQAGESLNEARNVVASLNAAVGRRRCEVWNRAAIADLTNIADYAI